MKAPTSWWGLSAYLLYAALVVASGFAYVLRRIKVGKKEGKRWPEILTDGTKPLTGSVWLDSVIVALLLLGTFAAFAYAFSRG